MDIHEAIIRDLQLSTRIDEASAVTFGGKNYPRDGWAVVMIGGPGSGKGTIIERQLLIDAKHLDTDSLKELYVELQKRRGEIPYDLHNDVDVSKLHAYIASKDWGNKMAYNFFNANGTLQNVIFDTTGNNMAVVEQMVNGSKKMGYKVAIVWVVANRAQSLLRNIVRVRNVKDDIFHNIHNAIPGNIIPFIQSGAGNADEVWVVFNGGTEVTYQVKQKDGSDLKDTVFKLNMKSGQPLSGELLEKINNFIGPKEVNPDNPEVYLNSKEIKKQLEPYYKGNSRPSGFKDLNFFKNK